MTPDEIPRSRAARGAVVARYAAEQTVLTAGTHAANLTRSPRQAKRALDRRQLEAIDQLVRVLGTMKGAAMKVGQMLSVIDIGLASAEMRPQLQERLAGLRDAAPEVPLAQMRAVVEEDLGRPLEEVFAEFDEQAIGSASIGQVYRARLHDGRDVAVKVQYPGMATAVRADMKNLALIMRIIKRAAPTIDADALAREIRERVGEELDYVLEAENQQTVAERFAGHPFVVVPKVLPELCGPRVLVSEYVCGRGFADILSEPADVRDRVGEIVYRFYCGSMHRLAQFSGDPHPGNFLLLDDGCVAFLDFGLYKRMDPEQVAVEAAGERAAAERDATTLHRLFSEAEILPDPDRVTPEFLLEYVLGATVLYLTDGVTQLASQDATDTFFSSVDPRSPYFRAVREQSLPAEHLISRRVVLFTLGILGQLGATANWHAIAREWLYDDEPATELGRLEAAFYAREG